MKSKHHRNLLQSAVFTAALSGSAAYAGPVEMTTPPAPAPMEDVVSGALNLDFYSHFISYGNDTWGDGSDAFSYGFYPSAELSLALPANFTATLGIWAEYHDKPAASGGPTIGGNVQEVDVWAGLAYAAGPFTVGATYQNWYYGNDVERILDLSFSYDTFLSPSLTVHHRLDSGAANDEGTILLLGLEHGFEVGPVSIAIPFGLAYFLEDDYHAAGADNGLGYGSIGVTASLPLTSLIGEAYGEWTLNAGVTYYVTDDDVIPNNPQNDFFVTNIGLSLSF